jgi:hypothetical protein
MDYVAVNAARGQNFYQLYNSLAFDKGSPDLLKTVAPKVEALIDSQPKKVENARGVFSTKHTGIR